MNNHYSLKFENWIVDVVLVILIHEFVPKTNVKPKTISYHLKNLRKMVLVETNFSLLDVSFYRDEYQYSIVYVSNTKRSILI